MNHCGLNKYMIACTNCQTAFLPGPGATGKFCSTKCSSKFNAARRKEQAHKQYLLNPKLCKQCRNPIPYSKKNKSKFCNRSCAAIFNNAAKDWDNIKTGPTKRLPQTPVETSHAFVGPLLPHTRIYHCTCRVSGAKWFSPTTLRIHPLVVRTLNQYARSCKFTFSLSKYPTWFQYATELIAKHGWYSASNRKNNLSGCSRDHLYSISEGFRNNIDPKLIAHPANCEIKLHKENQIKSTKSSISLSELCQRIKQFDALYGEV